MRVLSEPAWRMERPDACARSVVSVGIAREPLTEGRFNFPGRLKPSIRCNGITMMGPVLALLNPKLQAFSGSPRVGAILSHVPRFQWLADDRPG